MPGVWATLANVPELFVHVEANPSVIYAGLPEWIGGAYVVPTELTTSVIDRPPHGGCREWRSWLWALGAYDGGNSEVRVTLQGNANNTVLVDGLLIQVIERNDLEGHLLQCPVGGADVRVRSLQADLDLEPCVVNFRDDLGEFSAPFAFTLARGEVEVFHITASTTRRCLWTAELLLIVDGKRRRMYIDDDGQPFRTSGIDGLPTSTWSVRDQDWLHRGTG